MQHYLFFQHYFILFSIAAIVLGLIIGSFLNVVISRYPQMLKAEWARDCQSFLEQPLPPKPQSFNLARPSSHCPHCRSPIRLWHNIPIIGYLLLLGRCRDCHQTISPQYPIVEAVSAAVTLLVLYRFGVSYPALAAVILSWGLIALSGIDAREKILPDSLTLPMIWLGLLVNLFHLFTTPYLAIIGASVGYMLLWGIAKLYSVIRKREGMGHGDFKLLALLGAWLGIGAILNILISATLLGLIVGLGMLISKRSTAQQPLPFGPFLAIAGWLSMMFGPFLVNWLVNISP